MTTNFDFESYRSFKREEISKMSRIIEDFSEQMSETEVDLVIRSYVVLCYSYWESCYNYFVDALEEKYFDLEIRKLPHDLNEVVFLSLLKQKLSNHSKVQIKDLKSKAAMTGAMDDVSTKEELTVNQLTPAQITVIKKSTKIQTQNPNIEILSNTLKLFSMKYSKLYQKFVDNEYISPQFENSILFIISQRNSVAHKNNSFRYGEETYSNLRECINSFTAINFPGTPYAPEEFLKQILLEIDTLFRQLIHEVSDRIMLIKGS